MRFGGGPILCVAPGRAALLALWCLLMLKVSEGMGQ